MPETLDTIAEKITVLSASVDARFAGVDARFAGVDARFAEVDKRFAEVDKRFDEVDKRFDEVDKRFDEVTGAIVEQRQYTEFAFTRLQRDITRIETEMKGGFGRLDRKLDRVLDALTGTSSPRGRRRS